MKTYGQFCPIAQALEILAERWTLLVVRELVLGSRRFNELRRGVPLMSRTMLSQRLKTLQDAGIVERLEGDGGPEYQLTEAGAELRPVLEQIGMWGKRWAVREIRKEELDPSLLLWDMQRNLELDALPNKRTVVLFRFTDAKVGMRRFWLHVEPGAVDVCLTNPGFDVNLTVESDVRTLTEVWMGDLAYTAALRSGALTVEGPRTLTRAFPKWLKLSMFASIPRQVVA